MILALILLLFFFIFLLIKASDQIVIAIRRLSRETHTKIFILSAVFLAVATSLPELFVGITSALEGSPNLSLGNVVGANIANISLVAGLCAFIAGRVNVYGELIKKEVAIALLAGIIPLLLVVDGELSRVDGLILIFAYCAYATSFFKPHYLQLVEDHKRESFFHRFLREFSHPKNYEGRTKEAGRLFAGIALILLSSDFIVRIAGKLAWMAGMPIFLIGLTFLSIGTTLPELVFSLRALKKKEPTMFFGNLLGSVVANSTLIIGFTSLIRPIREVATGPYVFAVAIFVLSFLIFWYFIKTKRGVYRWEAGLLLALYMIFLIVEFIQK